MGHEGDHSPGRWGAALGCWEVCGENSTSVESVGGNRHGFYLGMGTKAACIPGMGVQAVSGVGRAS